EPSFTGEVLNTFGQYEILNSAQGFEFDTEKFIVYFGNNYPELKKFLEQKNLIEGTDFTDGRKLFERPRIPFISKSEPQQEQYEPKSYFPKPPFFCGAEDFAADVLNNFGQYEILNNPLTFEFDEEKFIVYFGEDYLLLKKIFELRNMIESKDFIDGRKLFERPRIPFGTDSSKGFVSLPPTKEISPKPQSSLLPTKKAQLGFGIMRMPQLDNGDFDMQEARRMIDEYMKSDFCYFDFHPAYCKRQAQKIVRELIVERYPRDSFLLANKMPWPIHDPKEYEKIFSEELQACGVEYFDYYLLHALSAKYCEMHERHGGFEFLQKLKAKGLVRRIGFSFHDSPEVLENILSNHPEMEFVQLQINYLDWEDPFVQSRRLYETAEKFGKQITVMEPIKGGSLANLENFNIAGGFDRKIFAEMALRFVASLDVSIILSGMSATEHVINNRQTLENPAPLSDDNLATYKKIRDTLKAKRLIPCTACRYCVAECPKKIAIPEILSLLNLCEHTGENDTTYLGRFKIFYRSYTQGRGKAGDCIKCGKCANRCPQRIQIPKHMTEAAKLFENK
ncbi:MAG: aldo/keto reductase, partial [Selenomonadaceae bacterium]|nr:aldo/keto reductase [Selenomonadaceae bacterium]